MKTALNYTWLKRTYSKLNREAYFVNTFTFTSIYVFQLEVSFFL